MPDLKIRATALVEHMDSPNCDLAILNRTYRAFALLNPLVSGTRRLYRDYVRPLLSPNTPTALLDVGCGGGDVTRSLARWAARDGLLLETTGIDPDPRAHAFAVASVTAGVSFRCATSDTLVGEGARFDIVLSNHVLHHLSAAEIQSLAEDSRRLAKRLVVHADLRRSALAYHAFRVAALPLAPGTFIRVDGLASIRRAYTPGELADALPDWRIETREPARLLAIWATDA